MFIVTNIYINNLIIENMYIFAYVDMFYMRFHLKFYVLILFGYCSKLFSFRPHRNFYKSIPT